MTMGESAGRTSDNEVTVFDSSGIAIQDLMVAEAIYVAAREANQVQYIDL